MVGARMSRRIGAVVVIVGLGLGTWVGANAQGPSSIVEATLGEPNQKTAEVTTEELRKILADRSATVFDARPFKEFAVSHIPGAVNVSAKPGMSKSQYVSDVHEIGRLLGGNKSVPIVLYCNGPFCGKSKRLAEELLAAGYTSIRRYQLGMPVWRALGGVAAIELEGAAYVHEADRTAVFLDARDPAEFAAGSIRGARNLPASGVKVGKDVGEVRQAKDDGRLPMEDHNTRIIVFGRDGAQARTVAEAVAKEAFHNVAFLGGTYGDLKAAIK